MGSPADLVVLHVFMCLRVAAVQGLTFWTFP